MTSKLILLFCIAVVFVPGLHCKTKVSDDTQRARLPEFLTELDLASLEASAEDVESLKKIVKRLAPEKNGEYLMYQGVMGQPGVDFPVLTTIPTTKFNCRGLKGGYYADLETNCQVFHICDNGRKISFLCPNGTVFQQSQLICDWWFKVDCGKSADLYEQSAEQLAKEERKRIEVKKMNSEYHRTSNGESTGQIYYQSENQNVNYDGRQNGRTNPFGQTTGQSQTSLNSPQQNGENNQRENGRNGNQFGQGQVTATPQANRSGRYNQNQNYNNEHHREEISTNSQQQQQQQQQQQFVKQNFNNYNTRQQQSIDQNSNSARNDYNKLNNRSPKAFTEFKNGFNEPTTTATSIFKEYQQPAESAAFATSSRNNRYNKSFQYNQFGGGNLYSSNQLNNENVKEKDTKNYFGAVIRTNGRRNQTPQAFTPIYKPRSSTTSTANPTTSFRGYGEEITTQRSYVNTDIYRQNTATQSSFVTPEIITQTTTDYREYSQPESNTYSQSYTTQDVNYPSTQKPYVNTDTYRHGTAAITEAAATTTWTSYDQTTTPVTNESEEKFSGYSTLTTERYTENYQGNTVTAFPTTHYDENNRQEFNNSPSVTPSTINDATGSDKEFEVTDQDKNFFSSSTQKPFLEEVNGNQETVVTSRNLSPYDTSFTYMNGKIASTLGPYVPFTKNYAYTTTTTTTTTTTNKPPVYTATVPTIPEYRTPVNSLATTATPWFFHTEKPKVSTRPLAEQEHAIEMLHSLKELETTPETFVNGSRVGLNIPPSSGPATLHTLALYFATAGDEYNSNETATDTAVRINNDDEDDQLTSVTTDITTSAELPINLLTKNTVKSYTDLFNLNSALQPPNNVTNTNTRIANESNDNDDYYSSSSSKEDAENDLDIQQSQGPVSGTNKRGNNPKLRELAQVFTHALSAYLQDPDTFRKVLTEIRPTEPPTTTISESTEITTSYPTTQDDYPSATKEKDEVLDFSDVTKATRRNKLTTPYPTTSQTFTTPLESTYQTYYTTQEATSLPNEIDESLNEAQSSDFRSSDEGGRNDFAQEVNHALRDSGANVVQNYNVDVTAVSGPSAPSEPQNEHDSYFPIGPVFSGNRFGGFQNNSAYTHQPYGNGVRPSDATPIGDNYTPESTPASYSESPDSDTAKKSFGVSYNEFSDYSNVNNFVTPKPDDDTSSFTSEDVPTTTTVLSINQGNTVLPSTRTPFIINYFDTATKASRNEDESLVTSGSVHSGYGNTGNDLSSKEIDETTPITSTTTTTTTKTTTDYPEMLSTQTNDNLGNKNTHWTASPTVTRLWETTIFLDPKHINQGLTGPGEDTLSTGSEDSISTTPISKQETNLTTETSDFGRTTRYETTNKPSWKWTPNENDSPTAFTLLPTVYATDNTATPSTRTYTTHSSIVTTVTSSVSSSTKEVPTIKNVESYNVTENEIVKAQEIFGGLNATSSNTLMRVMKQADRNSTVRQLVLLLISHCKGPMNKTMEEEKEQLLNALLKMPVNEFSTEESRDIIAGINNLRLPLGNSVEKVTPAPSTVTTTVAVTTFRNRRGRKLRTSTDNPKSQARSGDGDIAGTANSLSIEAESQSDNRALELLKSLYTIAAKWG